MLLSQASKYGIRAAVFLAGHQGEEPVLGRDIARALEVPAPFLAKILQDLSRRGLLLSFKGRGGGFLLARPAASILLNEIVEALEGPHFGSGCLLGLPACSEEDPCPLHDDWSGIRDEILQLLSSRTLEQALVDKT